MLEPSPDFIYGGVLSLLTSGFSAYVGYAIVKEKVNRLESDVRELQGANDRAHDTFVSYQHFNAVIEPIRKTLDNVQADIKEILGAIREKFH